jgi:hypothetical protein
VFQKQSHPDSKGGSYYCQDLSGQSTLRSVYSKDRGELFGNNKRVRDAYCPTGMIHLAAVDNRAGMKWACAAKPGELELKKEAIADII